MKAELRTTVTGRLLMLAMSSWRPGLSSRSNKGSALRALRSSPRAGSLILSCLPRSQIFRLGFAYCFKPDHFPPRRFRCPPTRPRPLPPPRLRMMLMLMLPLRLPLLEQSRRYNVTIRPVSRHGDPASAPSCPTMDYSRPAPDGDDTPTHPFLFPHKAIADTIPMTTTATNKFVVPVWIATMLFWSSCRSHYCWRWNLERHRRVTLQTDSSLGAPAH